MPGKHIKRDATTVFAYSHLNTPIDQWECPYCLKYFIKCNHINEIFSVAEILNEIPSASLKLVRFRAWITGAEMFSHISPSKIVSAIFQMCFGFFVQPPKVWCFKCGLDVSFYQRGQTRNSETKVKLNKARQLLWRRYPGTYLPIFSQLSRKTSVNELKMFIPICSFILSGKRWKTFYEIGIILY